jgi:hypothetical protein
MTKFVVEIRLLCRYHIEADTKEQAGELIWEQPKAGLDFLCDPGIVGEPAIVMMTEEEYDFARQIQGPNN